MGSYVTNHFKTYLQKKTDRISSANLFYLVDFFSFRYLDCPFLILNLDLVTVRACLIWVARHGRKHLRRLLFSTTVRGRALNQLMCRNKSNLHTPKYFLLL